MSDLSSTLYLNECVLISKFQNKLDFSHLSHKQLECQVHLDFDDSVCTFNTWEDLKNWYMVLIIVIIRFLLLSFDCCMYPGDPSFCPFIIDSLVIKN